MGCFTASSLVPDACEPRQGRPEEGRQLRHDRCVSFGSDNWRLVYPGFGNLGFGSVVLFSDLNGQG